jgi:hypothetical protein
MFNMIKVLKGRQRMHKTRWSHGSSWSKAYFLVSTDLHSIALPNHGGLLRFVGALSYMYIIVYT